MIMESINEETMFEVAEIQLSYTSKIKASLRPKIAGSKGVYDVFRKYWDEKRIDFVEQFKVLLLNRANRVIGIYEVSSGTMTGTVAHPKTIFVAALKGNACAVILADNHPSGNLSPSQADINLTRDMVAAGKFLHIPYLTT
jgi:DNA repair protein RadC